MRQLVRTRGFGSTDRREATDELTAGVDGWRRSPFASRRTFLRDRPQRRGRDVPNTAIEVEQPVARVVTNPQISLVIELQQVAMPAHERERNGGARDRIRT